MFWIASFFKVVDKNENYYTLDINPTFIINNIESFKNNSNFSNEKIDWNILENNNKLSYDEFLNKSNILVDKIKIITIKNIREGKFKLIKWNIINQLFTLKIKDLKENFLYDSENGSLKPNPNSKFFKDRNFNYFKKEINPSSKNFNDSYPEYGNPEYPSCLPCLSEFIEMNLVDIKNGLSNIGYALNYKKEKIGIIYDAGNQYAERISIARKIIKYFNDKKISNVICILSHEHSDHFNIFNLKLFKNWLKKIQSSVIYYSDMSISSKLQFISACKNKFPLKREDKILNMGKIWLKTFKNDGSVPSSKQNETSILVHSENVTLSGDQSYERIPKNWRENLRYFQVPHHGSKNSGNYKIAKNNYNALPRNEKHNLPNSKIKSYFEKNKKLIYKYVL